MKPPRKKDTNVEVLARAEIGRRHHTVDGGKPYTAAWAWANLGACTINGVSYSKDRRTGTTYRNEFPLPNAERIHGGAGLPNQPEKPTPLDGASC